MSLTFQAERRVFTVSELNFALRTIFENEFRNIWVSGEISGCKAATSGHYYFSLKDAQSQIKSVLFKGTARYLKFKPQDGMAVIARGNLDIYETRGEYQLIVELLEPQGAGALQLAFEQLKKKLTAEGLFEANRKKPLPKLPWRIGVVTSPTGAVIQDILHVLQRRFPGLHIRLYPAQVQGDGSVEAVCRGLAHFSDKKWADVVILARGGGSLEDLWTFNEEAVARAIAASKVPVISAIGHETDFTIADFVADLRAPTPSAAAEIAICPQAQLIEQIENCRGKLQQSMRYRIAMSSRALHQRGIDRATTIVHLSLGRRAQFVDDLDYRLRDALRIRWANQRQRLTDSAHRLRAADLRLRLAEDHRRLLKAETELSQRMRQLLWRSRSRLEPAQAHMTQLSPLQVLQRGYALVESEGHIVRDAAAVKKDATLQIRLAKGELDAKVTEVRTDRSK